MPVFSVMKLTPDLNPTSLISENFSPSGRQFPPSMPPSMPTNSGEMSNIGSSFFFHHSQWGQPHLESSSTLHPVTSPIRGATSIQQQQHQLTSHESELNSKPSTVTGLSSAAGPSGSAGLHYFPPMFWPSYRAAAAAAIAAASAASSPTGKDHFRKPSLNTGLNQFY